MVDLDIRDPFFHPLHRLSLYSVPTHVQEGVHPAGDSRDLLTLPLVDWRDLTGQTWVRIWGPAKNVGPRAGEVEQGKQFSCE